MPKENVDYELVPSEKHEDQAWNVRFLTGDYTETIIQFGAIKISGENMVKDDEANMTFNFDVIYSPDSELTAENNGLQNSAGEVLLDIIEQAILNNNIQTREANED